jgi:hypothetical protein
MDTGTATRDLAKELNAVVANVKAKKVSKPKAKKKKAKKLVTRKTKRMLKAVKAIVKKAKAKKLSKPLAAVVKRTKPKAKKPAAVVARPERLDLRLSKKEKAKLVAKAKATRRTVTSVVLEMIEKLR